MKRIVAALFLVLALLPITSAQNLKTIRKAIEAQTAKSNSAYKKRDLSILTSIMTEDFVSETPDGQLHSRPESIATLKQAFSQLVAVNVIYSKIITLEMKKGIAVVTTFNSMKGLIKLQNGKKSDFSVQYKSLEQWQNKGGTWKLHFARELPGGKTLINGQVR